MEEMTVCLRYKKFIDIDGDEGLAGGLIANRVPASASRELCGHFILYRRPLYKRMFTEFTWI